MATVERDEDGRVFALEEDEAVAPKGAAGGGLPSPTTVHAGGRDNVVVAGTADVDEVAGATADEGAHGEGVRAGGLTTTRSMLTPL